jgi:hypothetical protein
VFHQSKALEDSHDDAVRFQNMQANFHEEMVNGGRAKIGKPIFEVFLQQKEVFKGGLWIKTLNIFLDGAILVNNMQNGFRIFYRSINFSCVSDHAFILENSGDLAASEAGSMLQIRQMAIDTGEFGFNLPCAKTGKEGDLLYYLKIFAVFALAESKVFILSKLLIEFFVW